MKFCFPANKRNIKKRPNPKPPATANLVALTGSETVLKTMNKHVKGAPINRKLAAALSAALLNMG